MIAVGGSLWAVSSVGRWYWVVWKSKLNKPGGTSRKQCSSSVVSTSIPAFGFLCGVPALTSLILDCYLEVQDEANPVPSKLLLVRIFIRAVGTEPGHTFSPHLASPRVCISNKTSELTLIIFWYQSILAFLEIFSNLINLKCVFLLLQCPLA